MPETVAPCSSGHISRHRQQPRGEVDGGVPDPLPPAGAVRRPDVGGDRDGRGWTL